MGFVGKESGETDSVETSTAIAAFEALVIFGCDLGLVVVVAAVEVVVIAVVVAVTVVAAAVVTAAAAIAIDFPTVMTHSLSHSHSHFYPVQVHADIPHLPDSHPSQTAYRDLAGRKPREDCIVEFSH